MQNVTYKSNIGCELSGVKIIIGNISATYGGAYKLLSENKSSVALNTWHLSHALMNRVQNLLMAGKVQSAPGCR